MCLPNRYALRNLSGLGARTLGLRQSFVSVQQNKHIMLMLELDLASFSPIDSHNTEEYYEDR